MSKLDNLLHQSSARHQHLCPRQVLGVRMGMLAGHLLGLELPQTGKRLVTIVEAHGCATDGIAVASGCWLGRRTLFVKDFGKVAATFVDSQSGRAVRIVPSANSRRLAPLYAPETDDRWQAYLLGYQHMPDDELLTVQWVELTAPLTSFVGRDGCRVNCQICGEEIINLREVEHEGTVLCRACAGERYYLKSHQPEEDAPSDSHHHILEDVRLNQNGAAAPAEGFGRVADG